MGRVKITHLSITLQGEAGDRAEVAGRALTWARFYAKQRGVQISVSIEEEVVDDPIPSPSVSRREPK